MAEAVDSRAEDFTSEGLAISGQSLQFLLRLAGWLTIVTGVFLAGFGCFQANLVLVFSGLGILLEGLILLVAAGFVRNLADAVDQLLTIARAKPEPGSAPQV